jgi:hypothetical protein
MIVLHSIEEQNKQDLASPYISISKLKQGLSAKLTVDLKDYIEASLSKSDNLKSISNSVRDCMRGLHGALLWEKMLKTAIRDLSKEDGTLDKTLKAIEASAAGVYMSESFIELVKNSMDQIVLSNRPAGECVVELDLLIELNSDTIRMTISDNGGGFSDPFLIKMNDVNQRRIYIDEKGSVKQPGQSLRAHLFGGAGRGLRIFCAYIDSGDMLVDHGRHKKCYAKPAISTIQFSNHTDEKGVRGATLIIETSMAPLCKVTEESLASSPCSSSHATTSLSSDSDSESESPSDGFKLTLPPDLKTRWKKVSGKENGDKAPESPRSKGPSDP